MFEKPYNLLAYVVSLVLLALGVLLETNITVILAGTSFLVWDALYLKSSRSMKGRSIEQALQQTQNIREHISYFVAFYGVLFGILFTQSTEKQSRFLEVCADAGIPIALLILPFLLASVPLLFFPIQLAQSKSSEPSGSLKALVSFSALLQKLSIFMFVHIVLRIVYALADGFGQ